MCLKIKSDQVRNEKDLKRWLGRRQKFAYVYKILRKSSYENFYRSPICKFIWDFEKQKVFQVKRSSKPTKKELKQHHINKGFHVYTSLEAARSCLDKGEIIVKFRAKREDIIAIKNGYLYKEFNFDELVCTRLEFVKVLED